MLKQPLADRIRPESFEDMVGDPKLFGADGIFPKMLNAGHIPNMIFFGPSGTGKTTAANILAKAAGKTLHKLNATSAGLADVKNVISESSSLLGADGVLLYLDEMQYFNKKQQQSLLEYIENGRITLIASTTENPYFEVNQALISRSNVFELHSLDKEDIKKLIVRAITDDEKGMGIYGATITDDALDFLSDMAEGDARSALNAIELGILTTEPAEDGKIHIDIDVAQECIQRRVTKYDKDGDNHYDVISAFIKSIRGTDPDAALYYLARMLYAGEDIRFIARRIMISAAEDVGTADPMALNVAVSAAQAVERIGMPEAQIILAEAVAYVASAPKSNASYMGLNRAMDVVEHTKTAPIPNHLKDAHYKSAGKLGHGLGYLYSHDYPHHYVRQQYLPDGLTDSVFYEPTDNGKEKEIAQWLHWLKENDE